MKFLINTLTHWEEPPRARHQVANTLSKKYMVAFVAANKMGLPAIKVQQINTNLTIITPYFPVDHRIRYRIPVLNEIYQHWLFRRLVREYKNYEVINFDFTATRIFHYFRSVIYYCNDSFSSMSRHINPAFIARYHQYCESKVAAGARFCVGVSELLKENLLKFNPHSVEIALGSPDIDEYGIKVNYTPSKKRTVKVGFMGFIRSLNLSYNILNLLIEQENMIITLIGPVEDDFLDHVQKKEKMILKGSLTGKGLYEELNQFDVTIAPYSSRLINDSSRGVGTGSKIYQYFALGKPVVISQMAGLQKMDLPDGLIYVAAREEDFPALVNKAFAENSEEKIRQRIQFAKNNTWDKRMEDLIACYKSINE